MATLYVKDPSGTTYNMTIVTSGTTESFTQSGWHKLPNGLIIQWFQREDWTAITQGFDYTYTYPQQFCVYPITFPTACMSLLFQAWEVSTGIVITHADRGHIISEDSGNVGVGQIRYHMFGANGYICFDGFCIGW